MARGRKAGAKPKSDAWALQKAALDAIDRKDRKWFGSLSEEDRNVVKKNLWMYMRVMSSPMGSFEKTSSVDENGKPVYALGDEEKDRDAVDWYLSVTSDTVTSKFGAFYNHPELQFMRLQIVGLGGKRYGRRAFLPPPRRGKAGNHKLHDFMAAHWPHLEDSDIDEAILNSSMDELKEMLDSFGIEGKQQKEYLDGIQV